MINFIDILGYMAAGLTTFSFFPQLVKIIKTKSTKDISLEMFSMFLAGIICWLLYGIFLKSPPVIIANSLGIVMNSVILFYKIKYK